ncbi:hypothetical protein ECZU34_34050 [Escherichia coli]|nr:hypothetical protein ECZU34_34050 [Escherichia coli]
MLVPDTVTPAAASLALMMLSLAMVLMVTVGAALSTLYSCVAVALLPLTLVTRTGAGIAVTQAAISAAGTVVLQLPFAATVVV